MSVNTLVITGYGTNCHQESAHVARLAGADKADIIHFSDLVSTAARLDEYQFLIFPGGFLDGDDLGAAQAAAQRWRHLNDTTGRPLLDSLREFINAGKLVLGVCNGFQLLVKLGVLPALDGKRFERQVSLAHNSSARYEDRWVTLAVNPDSPCVLTRGCDQLTMPVRHGEGRLVAMSDEILARLRAENLVPVAYADPESGLPTEEYPANPNGSPHGIAGLCDTTGRVLGLMPHPEAFHHPTNHPGWARGEKATLGSILFTNAIAYLRDHPC